MEKYKILVVDDEEDICEILQYNLVKAGYDVDTAQSAEEAIPMLAKNYNLILLDIMMSGISGTKMTQIMKEEYNINIPIIFITALDTEADILNGFSLGADDYISKPFSIKEVIARVGAILNRTYANPLFHKNNVLIEKKENYKYRNLTIDYNEKRVYINDEEIILTKKECDILILLSENINKIFSRSDILKLVWKDESFVVDRTVDVHIARLRKKLGEYGDCIINRSGYGYSFQPE
jgi:Response regulators consisting of a CheY-like receiver domain and a winged-helix DNA-binding domain